jgi:hypothetical protein
MWGRTLSWDYATSAEMILRYMDAKILPGYAAIERGSIFGYSFFVYEQNKGVIGDLFVRDSVRDSVRDGSRGPDRHEVEEQLLTHVIETLQQSPGIHRVEAQLLAHHTGEVSRPFLQQGFSRHPRVFMNFDIGKHPQASLPALPSFPSQFEIRPWSFRSPGILRCPGTPHSNADRPDPLLAGAPRCGPYYASLRAPRTPLRRPRRGSAGRLDQESPRARIPLHLADGDGSE